MIGSKFLSARNKAVQSAVQCESLETRKLFATTGAVTGVLYNDDNGNQVRDSAETLNPGRTVFIDINDDGVLDKSDLSTTTDSNGRYTFSGLTPAAYRVRRLLPSSSSYQLTTFAARQFTGDTITITAGQTDTLDIGSTSKALVEVEVQVDSQAASARVYVDKNKNGVFDAGDIPAAEIAVQSTTQYTTYAVAVSPGDIRVAVTKPAGTTPTNHASGYIDTTITAGNSGTFGFTYSTAPAGGTISGVAFNDDNGNQQLDGGETINAGRSVYIDTNNNGKLDAGERSTTTGADGRYTFGGLANGSYYIRRVLPAGYQITTSTDPVLVFGTSPGYDDDIGSTARAIVQGHAYLTDLPPQDGPGYSDAIDGDTIYVDLNKNGKLDAGEPLAVTGQIQLGNADGDYRLALPPGSYRIASTDPDLKPVGYSTSYADVTLTTAQLANVDFSERSLAPKAGVITGVLFNDDNINGVKDAFETLNPDRTVFIDANENGKFDEGEQTTLTDSTGRYTFSDVPIGSYAIGRILPSGYQITNGLTFPNGREAYVSASSGQTTEADIGSTALAIVEGITRYTGTTGGPDDPSAISGVRVFADLNKNGKFDAGEPSVISGQYSRNDFEFALTAGTYRITTDDPAMKPDGSAMTYIDETLAAGATLDLTFSKPYVASTNA